MWILKPASIVRPGPWSHLGNERRMQALLFIGQVEPVDKQIDIGRPKIQRVGHVEPQIIIALRGQFVSCHIGLA